MEVKHAKFLGNWNNTRLSSNEKIYDCLGFYQREKLPLKYSKLEDQMGSGCGRFASSSPLEKGIDYSHRSKVVADEDVRTGRETNWKFCFHKFRM